MKDYLKVGQKITVRKISKKGWKKIGISSGMILFHKGKKILLFNPESRNIERIF